MTFYKLISSVLIGSFLLSGCGKDYKEKTVAARSKKTNQKSKQNEKTTFKDLNADLVRFAQKDAQPTEKELQDSYEKIVSSITGIDKNLKKGMVFIYLSKQATFNRQTSSLDKFDVIKRNEVIRVMRKEKPLSFQDEIVIETKFLDSNNDLIIGKKMTKSTKEIQSSGADGMAVVTNILNSEVDESDLAITELECQMDEETSEKTTYLVGTYKLESKNITAIKKTLVINGKFTCGKDSFTGTSTYVSVLSADVASDNLSDPQEIYSKYTFESVDTIKGSSIISNFESALLDAK